MRFRNDGIDLMARLNAARDILAALPGLWTGSGSAAPGKLDLVCASVNLNALVGQCVALMQPQANQQRIIIRAPVSRTRARCVRSCSIFCPTRSRSPVRAAG